MILDVMMQGTMLMILDSGCRDLGSLGCAVRKREVVVRGVPLQCAAVELQQHAVRATQRDVHPGARLRRWGWLGGSGELGPVMGGTSAVLLLLRARDHPLHKPRRLGGRLLG